MLLTNGFVNGLFVGLLTIANLLYLLFIFICFQIIPMTFKNRGKWIGALAVSIFILLYLPVIIYYLLRSNYYYLDIFRSNFALGICEFNNDSWIVYLIFAVFPLFIFSMWLFGKGRENQQDTITMVLKKDTYQIVVDVYPVRKFLVCNDGKKIFASNLSLAKPVDIEVTMIPVENSDADYSLIESRILDNAQLNIWEKISHILTFIIIGLVACFFIALPLVLCVSYPNELYGNGFFERFGKAWLLLLFGSGGIKYGLFSPKGTMKWFMLILGITISLAGIIKLCGFC